MSAIHLLLTGSIDKIDNKKAVTAMAGVHQSTINGILPNKVTSSNWPFHRIKQLNLSRPYSILATCSDNDNIHRYDLSKELNNSRP